MNNTIVKLAKSYSNELMKQIYFMELIKETVAEVLVVKRGIALVDDIAHANSNAAYELDVHLKELQNERI
ncbi:hypothetical protein [Priestia megaterium]|uniref:hypothetical protein n=1 Tax=Priestia megaterium TaxID=1404 RepID=UPI00285E7D70|nr:hypothetical protein [Priestia megaterium]MDR7244236.1 hypothetical protein [Priestia megaterium]